jgi:hypothetical protein
VARLLEIPPGQDREQQVVAALGAALSDCLHPWVGAMDLSAANPQLMRWGAAFPIAPGLPSELMVCPQSRVGFCGDYIAGVGFGRIEGALRSAERLALALHSLAAD